MENIPVSIKMAGIICFVRERAARESFRYNPPPKEMQAEEKIIKRGKALINCEALITH